MPQPFRVEDLPFLWDHVLPDALFVHDENGRFLEVNRKACESVGYTRSELLTMNVTDVELDFDLPRAQEAWSRIRPGITEILHGRQRRKDGTIFPVEVHFGVFEEESGRRVYFGTVRDITGHQRAESVLRDQAAQLRGVFQSMSEGLVLQMLDGTIIDANAAAQTILGLTRDQLLGKSSLDPDWQAIREDETPFPGHEHPAMVTARTGQPVQNQIMGVRDPKTGLRWISINSQPVVASEGNALSGVICTFTDVTDQRRVTAQLRVARADLQAVLDNVPARITSWFPDQTIRFANAAALAHYGMDAESLSGRQAREIAGDERYSRFKPFIDAALAGAVRTYEDITPQPDGSNRISKVTLIPEMDEGSVVGVYALASDITELRAANQRIRNLVQRLEIAREDERKRVSRILHERIAQDLFAMKLWITELARESKIDLVHSEVDQAIATAVDDAVEVVRDLANDLRPDMLAHLPLTAGLTAHARQFSALSGLRIRVVERAPIAKISEEVRLACFRAVQELLANVARHAQASEVVISLASDTARFIVEVSDDGIGMDSASMNKDSALGLLGIQERFSALDGTVDIRRNDSRGTSVTISVPLIPDPGTSPLSAGGPAQ